MRGGSEWKEARLLSCPLMKKERVLSLTMPGNHTQTNNTNELTQQRLFLYYEYTFISNFLHRTAVYCHLKTAPCERLDWFMVNVKTAMHCCFFISLASKTVRHAVLIALKYLQTTCNRWHLTFLRNFGDVIKHWMYCGEIIKKVIQVQRR
jgi:hypothetical protein